MQHEFEYEFDEAFIGTAMKRDMFWRSLYASLLMAGVVVCLYLLAGMLNVWTIIMVVLGMFAVSLAMYVVWRRSKRQLYDLWATQSPEHIIQFKLDDEGFDVKVGTSSSRYEWGNMRRLWRYPDVWLIEIVKNVSVFLPRDDVSQDVRNFIVERCRANGVRV